MRVLVPAPARPPLWHHTCSSSRLWRRVFARFRSHRPSLAPPPHSALHTRSLHAGARKPPPALVTFDCTGTVIEQICSTGFIYKSALMEVARGGSHATEVEAIQIQAIEDAFREVYKKATELEPCFGAGVESSEAWWRHVVGDTLVKAGTPPAVLEAHLSDAFDELYWRTFLRKECWRLIPGTEETLQALDDWRLAQPNGQRMAMGVISNWDERLLVVLKEMGIFHYMDAVIFSRDLGVEKPAREIFDKARDVFGVSSDARAVHIGDTFQKDIVGAHNAGFEGVLLTSKYKLGRCSAEQEALMHAVPHTKLFHLKDLPKTLGVPPIQ